MLCQTCKQDFAVGDRRRGEEYFSSDRIEIDEIGTLGAQATAVGSQDYDIYLDFSELRRGRLGVFCDCPRFEGGENCKHLWAALRKIDSEYDLATPVRSSVRLFPCRTYAWQLGRPLQTSATPRRSLITRPAQNTAEWKQQLSSLLNSSEATKRRAAKSPINLLRPTQIWFAVALSDTVDSDRFSLHLYASERNADGKWTSPPKKLSVAQAQLLGSMDATDRNLLSRLKIVRYTGSSFYRLDDVEYNAHLPETSLEEALQQLCESQKFVLSMTDEPALNAYQALEFDGPEPWRLRLLVEPENSDLAAVTPQLIRPSPTGLEVRDLREMIAVCESGAVIFDRRVGRMYASDVKLTRGCQRIENLRIPTAEIGAFLAELSQLEQLPQIALHESLSVRRQLGTPKGKLILARPEPGSNYLEAEVRMCYGSVEVTYHDAQATVWDASQNLLVDRDHAAEANLWEDLTSFRFKEYQHFLHLASLQIHKKWFVELVQQLLQKNWEIVADDRRVRNSNTINIQVRSGQDWFDVTGSVDFDGLKVELPTLLKALDRGEDRVVLDDGSQGLLPQAWLRQFETMKAVGDKTDDAIRFGKNQALVLDMLLAESEQVQVDRGYSNWCKKLLSSETIRAIKQPRGFRGELRNYQREGLAWLKFLQKCQLGGCLADDMGLGKTIQVLALLEQRRVRKIKDGEARHPSIAVVPKSLVFNWLDEAQKFSPKLRLLDFTGPQRHSLQSEFAHCDLIVTTYATLRRDIEIFSKLQFDYAILDEATAVKNQNSQASKAVRLLRAEHRLAMTGTPIENHMGDLWALFEFLNPGMLGRSTASMLQPAKEDSEKQLHALSKALRPFTLRRTKEQVLTDLPQKTEQTLHCEMNAKQKKLYTELKEHYRVSLNDKIRTSGIKRAKIHVLEALLRLRQAACDPRLIDPKQKVGGAKIELLMQQLGEVTEEGHKALVFSQFTSLLHLVEKEIKAQGWSYQYLDGKTSNRSQRVHRFQEDENCQLFLISLKAGGHGLNLTAADYVFILDPWWNPAVEAQAIDRAHRLGQQRPVTAYRLIAKGTVEDKIVALQQSKRELADAIIRADESLIRSLSMEDLQVLFE
ncbi:MAG: DEAD/DEAH box helicase [bacterium]|nr:DEAD/DEAH box helicase [bacterium]